MKIPRSRIRNFCIIAHIDHGKSTLADRFIEKAMIVDQRKFQNQLLGNRPLGFWRRRSRGYYQVKFSRAGYQFLNQGIRNGGKKLFRLDLGWIQPGAWSEFLLIEGESREGANFNLNCAKRVAPWFSFNRDWQGKGVERAPRTLGQYCFLGSLGTLGLWGYFPGLSIKLGLPKGANLDLVKPFGLGPWNLLGGLGSRGSQRGHFGWSRAKEPGLKVY